jgi:hypothetical protein
VTDEGSAVTILSSAERKLLDATPETGFLSMFEEWASRKTDAPGYMLQAAGLMALSLSAGDTLVLPNFFGSKVYLNLYILIVGPSTTLRKSTVLGMVTDILPVNLQTGEEYIVTMDDVSVQAFNKVAGKQGEGMAPILMAVDEVAGLFQNVRRKNSYLAGFDKTLMKAYDHSPIYINRVASEVVAPQGAFINIFAASTPEPLMEVLNSEDVASGLLPRFLIFDATTAIRGTRRSLMERLEGQEQWEEEAEALRKRLGEIAWDRAMGIPTTTTDQGGMGFQVTTMGIAHDALVRLDDIDRAWSKEAGQDSSEWAAIKGRGFWHLVKLAGLYALSRAGKEAEVSLIDVLRASLLVETTISDLVVMQDELGSNHLERRIKEAEELVGMSPVRGMMQAVIARRMKLSMRDLVELRETMRVRNLIEVDEGTGRWRKYGA